MPVVQYPTITQTQWLPESTPATLASWDQPTARPLNRNRLPNVGQSVTYTEIDRGQGDNTPPRPDWFQNASQPVLPRLRPQPPTVFTEAPEVIPRSQPDELLAPFSIDQPQIRRRRGQAAGEVLTPWPAGFNDAQTRWFGTDSPDILPPRPRPRVPAGPVFVHPPEQRAETAIEGAAAYFPSVTRKHPPAPEAGTTFTWFPPALGDAFREYAAAIAPEQLFAKPFRQQVGPLDVPFVEAADLFVQVMLPEAFAVSPTHRQQHQSRLAMPLKPIDPSVFQDAPFVESVFPLVLPQPRGIQPVQPVDAPSPRVFPATGWAAFYPDVTRSKPFRQHVLESGEVAPVVPYLYRDASLEGWAAMFPDALQQPKGQPPFWMAQTLDPALFANAALEGWAAYFPDRLNRFELNQTAITGLIVDPDFEIRPATVIWTGKSRAFGWTADGRTFVWNAKSRSFDWTGET